MAKPGRGPAAPRSWVRQGHFLGRLNAAPDQDLGRTGHLNGRAQATRAAALNISGTSDPHFKPRSCGWTPDTASTSVL